jgi:hypothetical protein
MHCARKQQKPFRSLLPIGRDVYKIMYSNQNIFTVVRNISDAWVQFLCYRNPETKYADRTDPSELNRVFSRSNSSRVIPPLEKKMSLLMDQDPNFVRLLLHPSSSRWV